MPPLVTPFDERRARSAGSPCQPCEDGCLVSGVDVVTAFGTTGEGVSIDRGPSVAELFDRMTAHGVPPQPLAECVYGPSSVEAGRRSARR